MKHENDPSANFAIDLLARINDNFSMDPEEFKKAFEEAEALAATLQNRYSNAAQAAGHVSSVLLTTKSYWTQLAEQSGNQEEIIPILHSGIATVREISHSLSSIQTPSEPFDTLRTVSLSASSFGSNTAATSSYVSLATNTNNQFQVDAIPVPDFSQEITLADRFTSIDPSLGQVCREIWESLYGTTADPERSAMYMVRQTWDHLFDKLAPDEEVRASSFWVEKEGPKPELVTREERINYAVEKHVTNPEAKSLLLASSKQMLELYQSLNRAHQRNEIDKIKARRALNSIYSWLMQWADALGI